MEAKPVVVGVDGSVEALQAVEWAAMEAARHGAPLRIVSAPTAMPRIRAYHASAATVAVALRGISENGRWRRLWPALRKWPPAWLPRPFCCPGRRPMAVVASGTDAAMLVMRGRAAQAGSPR